jgi:hypothetical protein
MCMMAVAKVIQWAYMNQKSLKWEEQRRSSLYCIPLLFTSLQLSLPLFLRESGHVIEVSAFSHEPWH